LIKRPRKRRGDVTPGRKMVEQVVSEGEGYSGPFGSEMTPSTESLLSSLTWKGKALRG